MQDTKTKSCEINSNFHVKKFLCNEFNVNHDVNEGRFPLCERKNHYDDSNMSSFFFAFVPSNVYQVLDKVFQFRVNHQGR